MLVLFVQETRSEKRLEMPPVLRIVMEGPLYQDKPNNMQHWQVTIIIDPL